MTVNPIYHLLEAGDATIRAVQQGDWESAGSNAFNTAFAVVETATVALPIARAATLRTRAATNSVGDEAIVVRGGASDVPASGEVFSGSYGSTVEGAAAGVPHGQVRVATAGDIRAGGGSVTYAPEWNPRVGQTNFQHVNVCLGAGSCPFGELMPNPVPKPGRFGGPAYANWMWGSNDD